MATSKNLFHDLKRSWTQHFTVQLSTFVVLTATFTVIFSVTSVLLNLKGVLSKWGQDIQVTVFLEEELNSSQLAQVQKSIETLGYFKSVQYVNKEIAKKKFIDQMPGFAKDVIEDPDFANPFPASFQLGGLGREQISSLSDIAQKLMAVTGVEDVAYGQEWVENYAGFLKRVSQAGGFVLLTLLMGSLFVISNSIRAALSQRREEIEIQELVGATAKMIRRPFLFEGAVMGFAASSAALLFSYLAYWLELRVIQNEMHFLSLSEVVSFFRPLSCIGLLFFGTISGALGAWLCVRKINSGWSARREGVL